MKDVQDIASKWQSAYELANNNPAPTINYERGWFNISGMKHRRKQVIDMTNTLLERVKENGRKSKQSREGNPNEQQEETTDEGGV